MRKRHLITHKHWRSGKELSTDSQLTPFVLRCLELWSCTEVVKIEGRRCILAWNVSTCTMAVPLWHTHTENSMPNDADTQNKIANEDLKVHAFIVKSAFMYLFVWNTFSKIFSELQMTVDAAAQVKIHLHVLKQRQQCEKWLWVYTVQKQQGEQQ